MNPESLIVGLVFTEILGRLLFYAFAVVLVYTAVKLILQLKS